MVHPTNTGYYFGRLVGCNWPPQYGIPTHASGKPIKLNL